MSVKDKYKTEQRRERNKIRKIKKWLRKHPTDRVSETRLQELQALIK